MQKKSNNKIQKLRNTKPFHYKILEDALPSARPILEAQPFSFMKIQNYTKTKLQKCKIQSLRNTKP